MSTPAWPLPDRPEEMHPLRPITLLRSILRRWTRRGLASWAPIDLGPALEAGGSALREPYRESVWVHAAIRHISTPLAALPIEHSAHPPGGRSAGATHAAPRRTARAAAGLISDPRLDRFWASPAVGMSSFGEFVEALVCWRKLAGEAFIILGDDSLVPFPEVRDAMAPVLVARPDRMRHVVQGGRLVGWEYTDGDGRSHALLPDQVVQLRQWNPYDDFRGLGDYEAARMAAETDAASGRFVRNLAAAQGDQGVYVVAKSGVLDEKQRDQITALLIQKRRMQQQGVFSPVFLTGDVSVEDPKVRSVDAAFLESRRMSAGEIFVAFGVPPSLAKERAAYATGSSSDYARLICDTCVPESTRIAEVIGVVSSILLGRSVWASFVWDEHPVMQEVRRERMATIEKLWSVGMPMREVSRYLDLDLPRFPGDETGWLPMRAASAARAHRPGTEAPAVATLAATLARVRSRGTPPTPAAARPKSL